MYQFVYDGIMAGCTTLISVTHYGSHSLEYRSNWYARLR